MGRELGNAGSEVRIPLSDLMRHAAILGSTGSGKTTTAGVLANGLRRYGLVVVLDWYGEYSNLPNTRRLLPGVDIRVPLPLQEVHEFVDIIEEVFSLTPTQSFILQKVVEESKVSDLRELYEVIEGYPVRAKWMNESRMSLLRRISVLGDSKYSRIYSTDLGGFVGKLKVGSINVIDYSSLKNIQVRRLGVLGVLKALEYLAANSLISTRVFTVVEEVQNIIRSEGASYLNRLVAEVRRFGISLILVTQSPSILGSNILLNCNLKIIHSLKSRADIELIIKSLGYADKYVNYVPRLGVGEALVDYPSLPHPLLVRVYSPIPT